MLSLSIHVNRVLLTAEEMEQIKTLDTNASSFFVHRDHKMVKWLGERELKD